MFKQRNGPLEVDTTLVFCMLLATKIGLKSGMSVLLKCGPSFVNAIVWRICMRKLTTVYSVSLLLSLRTSK
jgi:hypothetical protein